MSQRALFICDSEPRDGINGQQSYNNLIMEIFYSIGYKTDLLITGFENPSRSTNNINNRFHYKKLFGAWVPVTFGAIARNIKRQLHFFWKKDGSSKKIAKIGRFLSKKEKQWLSHHPLLIAADIVVIDTIFRYPSDHLFKMVDGKRRIIILIEHDIFYNRTVSFERNGYIVLPQVSKKIEEDIYNNFDIIIAISDTDNSIIKGITSELTVITLMPFIKKQDIDKTSGLGEILYVGSSATHNVDGLQWFIDECWSTIRTAYPHAKLNVVGSISNSISAQPGIIMHGQVQDLKSVANLCSFAINPVRMGSGVKVKVIDYINLGLGCVTTDLGAEGFPLDKDLPLLIANSGEMFSVAVIRLLRDINTAHDLGQRARRYSSRFDTNNSKIELQRAIKLINQMQ